ncbi:hypothetical protein [Halosegnis longus]|uniref:hypothetical protein n=1 Tax=Halosegnis longus TaxID=2216012 RepID=UPI00129DC8B1|nr:hypothetical protein [Halosegnis longus]
MTDQQHEDFEYGDHECPECGSTQFREVVLAKMTTDPAHGMGDVDHIGDAVMVWCNDCDELLVDRDANDDLQLERLLR